MRKHWKIYLIIALGVMAIAGCGVHKDTGSMVANMSQPMILSDNSRSYMAASSEFASYDDAVMDDAVSDDNTYDESDSGSEIMADSMSYERVVIRTADMSIRVKDPNAVFSQISDLVNKYGGYVIDMNVMNRTYSNGESLPYGTISIRVNADKLDEALNDIAGMTASPEDLLSKSIHGEDVTDQYVDTELQIQNKEKTLDKLYEILADAVSTEDTLNVYTQISVIEGDLDMLKGQMKYIKERAKYSLINVDVQHFTPDIEIAKSQWKVSNSFMSAVQGLVDGFQNGCDLFLSFVIGVLPNLLLFLVLPLAFIAFIVRLIVRKINAHKKSKDS